MPPTKQTNATNIDHRININNLTKIKQNTNKRHHSQTTIPPPKPTMPLSLHQPPHPTIVTPTSAIYPIRNEHHVLMSPSCLYISPASSQTMQKPQLNKPMTLTCTQHAQHLQNHDNERNISNMRFLHVNSNLRIHITPPSTCINNKHAYLPYRYVYDA